MASRWATERCVARCATVGSSFQLMDEVASGQRFVEDYLAWNSGWLADHLMIFNAYLKLSKYCMILSDRDRKKRQFLKDSCLVNTNLYRLTKASPARGCTLWCIIYIWTNLKPPWQDNKTTTQLVAGNKGHDHHTILVSKMQDFTPTMYSSSPVTKHPDWYIHSRFCEKKTVQYQYMKVTYRTGWMWD